MVEDESREELMELGGSIQLSGFSEMDTAELIVVKKMAGSYARKFSDRFPGFERLRLHLKVMHKKEASEKYDLTGKLFLAGRIHVATEVDKNIYFAMDKVLKQLEKDAIREHEKGKKL